MGAYGDLDADIDAREQGVTNHGEESSYYVEERSLRDSVRRSVSALDWNFEFKDLSKEALISMALLPSYHLGKDEDEIDVIETRVRP